MRFIQSQQKFNALFDAMKNDFSNKKMRNFINSNPDRYFKGFRYDLEEAMKSYRNKCEKQIHQLIDLEDAAFGLTEFGILLGLAEKLGTLISNHISKMNKMSSEYFETHFIAKQRLKDWDSC